MVSFYPGPSKPDPFLNQYFSEAVTSGILGVNHRSNAFMQLYQDCVVTIQQQLGVPDDYLICFTSSATECWQIIGQERFEEGYVHVYNGAFGEKWAQYSKFYGNKVNEYQFYLNEIPEIQLSNPSLIAYVLTETSNGFLMDVNAMKNWRNNNQTAFIAVDATSALGGIAVDFSLADIWFASVQKCLGLPAGMAILILSPQIQQFVLNRKWQGPHNSLYNLVINARNFQTTHTPNVLGIYLLNKVLQNRDNIHAINKTTYSKNEMWSKFFEEMNLPLLINEKMYQSPTVLVIKSEDHQHIKENLYNQGFILGNGYGSWQKNTFRIANFPSHSFDDISNLQKALRLCLNEL